jgi:hypothetical protein
MEDANRSCVGHFRYSILESYPSSMDVLKSESCVLNAIPAVSNSSAENALSPQSKKVNVLRFDLMLLGSPFNVEIILSP